MLIPAVGTAVGKAPSELSADETQVDTVIMVDNIQVTAIKQGSTLRDKPLSVTVLDADMVERLVAVAERIANREL